MKTYIRRNWKNLLLNILPAILGAPLFRLGGYVSYAIFAHHIILNGMNHKTAKSIWEYIGLNGLMLLSGAIGNACALYLYFIFVSSDNETAMVGMVYTEVCVILAVILTLFKLLLDGKR